VTSAPASRASSWAGLALLATAVVTGAWFALRGFDGAPPAEGDGSMARGPRRAAARSPGSPAVLPAPELSDAAAAPQDAGRVSPVERRSAVTVHLENLGLRMQAPEGFQPRVSGDGTVLAPQAAERGAPNNIAVHPARGEIDRSVYTESRRLPNGASVRYRLVERPGLATELQGVLELSGTMYFVSCRVANDGEAPLPGGDWCLRYLGTLER
jgi:hypothetical protein